MEEAEMRGGKGKILNAPGVEGKSEKVDAGVPNPRVTGYLESVRFRWRESLGGKRKKTMRIPNASDQHAKDGTVKKIPQLGPNSKRRREGKSCAESPGRKWEEMGNTDIMDGTRGRGVAAPISDKAKKR